MAFVEIKAPVGKSVCLWTNQTQAVYTAKITLHNPKPLPATVQYWSGQWAEKVSGKPSVKIPAKMDSRVIELEVIPGEMLCVYTDNRDITVELDVFTVMVDKTEIDISASRQTTVRVGVSGITNPVKVGPASVARGLTVTPKEAIVRPRQPASFDISASPNTDSIRKVRFGILDAGTSTSATVSLDCRTTIRNTYRDARDGLGTSAKPSSGSNKLIDSMKAAYMKKQPDFSKK